jgi:hypothetical protein
MKTDIRNGGTLGANRLHISSMLFSTSIVDCLMLMWLLA